MMASASGTNAMGRGRDNGSLPLITRYYLASRCIYGSVIVLRDIGHPVAPCCEVESHIVLSDLTLSGYQLLERGTAACDHHL
jgi:hypothetical protein